MRGTERFESTEGFMDFTYGQAAMQLGFASSEKHLKLA